MRGAGSVFRWVFFVFLIQALMAGQGVAAAPEEAPAPDIQELVRVIEDPKEREVLLERLRALAEAQKAPGAAEKEPLPKEEPLLGMEEVFASFERLSAQVIRSAARTGELLAGPPGALRATLDFLSQPENRSALLRTAAALAAALLLALILRLILRPRLPSAPEDLGHMGVRLGRALMRWLLSIIPSGLALLSLFVLFRVLPSPAPWRALVFHVFTVAFLYRVAVEAFRAFLSPDEARLRAAPMGDETANYYWLWLKRFANYGAFYAVLMGFLAIAEAPGSASAFIRGLLLLGFPAMVTVLILQLGRDLRMRLEEPADMETEAGGKRRVWGRRGTRYLPAVVVIYTWTVFLFLIVNYGKGFSYLLKATLGTVVAVPLVFAALRLLHLLFKRLFAIRERIKDRFPGFEEKANRYITVIRKVFSAVIMVIGGGVIAQIWGIPVGAFISSDTGALIVLRVITIGVTLGVVFLVIQLNLALSQYLLRPREGKVPSQKTQTLVPMVRTAVSLGAGFVGGIVVLGRLGVDTTPILAGAGIVGLAVGFGAQTLVKDLINGLFILFEESVRVGDWADLGGKGGLVESVGLRTVRLRDLHGSVHVIPNSSIEVLTNFTKEFSRAVMDVGIAYREDVDQVIEVLKEIGNELKEDPDFGGDILEPLEIFGLDRFDDSAVVIRIRFTTRPLKQWGIRREFYRRMKRVFDERGIEIPFPHRTIYLGVPKAEPAPPLNIHMARADEEGTGQ